MKKLITLSLCVALVLLSFVGCGSSSDNNAESEKTPDKTQVQYECGKSAYDELSKAAEICAKMGDAVYGAWYFAIYEADYDLLDSSEDALYDLSDKVGVSVDDLTVAAEEYLGDLAGFVQIYLDDFNYTVHIVSKALEINGTVTELDTALSNSKAQLKTMTQEYSDYDQYPMLKSLYSEIDSYASFLKAPTGSFEQLKTTIEKYETNIRTYKSDLSFVFED